MKNNAAPSPLSAPKSLAPAALIMIIVVILLYAGFSFTLWTTDPAKWSDAVRGFFAFFELGVILVFCATYLDRIYPHPNDEDPVSAPGTKGGGL